MASRRSRVRTPSAPPRSVMRFFVYILQSQSSGRFYIGQTKNLVERVAYHNAGYSLALKNRGPWTLIYYEEYPSRSEAVRRESQIKKQKNRRFIEQLVCVSRLHREGHGFEPRRLRHTHGSDAGIIRRVAEIRLVAGQSWRTHSVFSFGGRIRVCITTQNCSVFSCNPRNCSGVASGAATSK
jgi:putative endonuclease